MSADLTGYLVIGPENISKTRQRAAIYYLGELKSIAANVVKMKREAGEGKGDVMDIPGIRPLIKAAEDTGWEGSVVLYAKELISTDPEKMVNDFVDFWENPGGSDTVSRTVRDRKILFAGGESYDEECAGDGYLLLKNAFKYGFAEILGIE